MGLEFGRLGVVIRGVTFFRLSAHEQKAFVGCISHGVPNIIRRINDSIFRITPFVLYTYLQIRWAKEEYHALSRKDPALYANDK